MADKKISALTGATTPLAGTEVLPIVQSGATVKVATNDLTVRNFRANATTGILQVTGPVDASTRVMTVPDANFTAARTDAAQSFTGNQTLSTGNLIIGTSGQGIDFSATPGTGTSELFADYEEGTWTPTIFGASTAGVTTYTLQQGVYRKVGTQVTVWFRALWSAQAGGVGNTRLGGLPFTINTSVNSFLMNPIASQNVLYTAGKTLVAGWGATGAPYTVLDIGEVGAAVGYAGLAIAATGDLMGSVTYTV